MIITKREMLSVTIKITTVRNRSCIHRSPAWCCDDLEGVMGEPLEGGSGGKDIYIYLYTYAHIYIYIIMTDLRCCMAETNTKL